MKIITGDLIKLAHDFDVIVHGCNCFHTMGAGIAAAIRKKWPQAYEADLATKCGARSKLGSISIARDGDLVILNAYTQFDFGRSRQDVDYNAIRNAFSLIATLYPNKRIAYPKIGCGLAGGDWDIVSKIIDEELKDCDHTLVVLP